MSRVEWYGEKVIEEYNTALEKAMKQAVLLIEADAKKNCPVDTGRLRSSITNVVEELANEVIRGRVGTNTEYAPDVFLGTVNQSAQPTLRPALEKNFKKVVKLLKAAV